MEAVEVNNEDDAEPILAKLKDKSINTIIGGVMSSRIAHRLGMRSLFIKTGREAIYSALKEAKRVAAVRRREKERAEQFRTILDYSDEGIIAVDVQGKINLMNRAAIQITNLRDEAIGGKLSVTLPKLALDKVLATGESEIGDLHTINNQ
ncbi:PrpR N-terminal domain-containing protein [Sporomusa acidovorans]|uniref:PAS domain-containing protein n=1 Tax=Sporomusa acidovorans (strain ATCC 49682 / DSM 3132 / Mol) TaxID=1123286 RepID=A0ABZ3J218_SPOA4|nr:PrpR N-terminal domain-containing protein [Sporomusa acidovorans]OZC15772.1 sensory histidine kinase AtoS [Sporomusa acidovorans DSM 3132]SDF63217.1 PAS domain S-box-containing protein [Sporomusa acidovorans]